MARPREFNRDTALETALGIFWMRGYAATSMSDLQRGLGIGRQSLYNAFGGKHEIFLEALELYLGRNRAMVDRLLVAEQGLDAIEAYLVATATSMGGFPRKACFLFNTSVELGPHDDQTRVRLDRGLQGMRDGFVRCLDHARGAGVLPADTDPDALSVFLTAQVGGMAALARVGSPPEALLAVATSAMRALR